MQARGAIGNYAVHAVVANLLHTRKERVWIVRNAAATEPSDSGLTGTPALTWLEPVIEKEHMSPTDPCTCDEGESPDDGFSRGLEAVRNTDILPAGVRGEVQRGTIERTMAMAGSTSYGDGGVGSCDGGDAYVQVLDRPAAEPYIETQIVAEIITLHDKFLVRPPGGSQ